MSENPKEIVIDCESKILGRLASQVAKMLLMGDSVSLINAEKAAISGHSKYTVANYKQKLELQDKANPEHSPAWSRRPDLLVKRVIRGMLPHKKAKGKDAMERLRVYVGVPAGLAKASMAKIDAKDKKETYETSMTVKELSESLGYKVS